MRRAAPPQIVSPQFSSPQPAAAAPGRSRAETRAASEANLDLLEAPRSIASNSGVVLNEWRFSIFFSNEVKKKRQFRSKKGRKEDETNGHRKVPESRRVGIGEKSCVLGTSGE